MAEEFEREFGPDAAGGGGRKRNPRKICGKDRRDSVAPFAGLVRQLSNMSEEDETGSSKENIKSRLTALEQSTQRIERLLGRLCADLDEELGKNGSEDDDKAEDEVETLEDMDGSVLN